MKHALLVALLLAEASRSLAFTLEWQIGGSQSKPLKLNGELTTAETFNPYFELRLMDIGLASDPYSASRGYTTFRRMNTGTHRPDEGTIGSISAIIPDAEDLFEHQLLPVLYEIATEKHYYLSSTLAGGAIPPYLMPEITGIPGMDLPRVYYPTSSSDFFYKGEEIPPFCGWLSKYNLTENDLTGISTNLVNLAFAVNANPTDFSGIELSITNTTLSAESLSGGFIFNAKDAAGTPTAVTPPHDSTNLVLRTTASLAVPFSPAPASYLSLTNGIFSVNATQDIQFLRLDFTPAELW